MIPLNQATHDSKTLQLDSRKRKYIYLHIAINVLSTFFKNIVAYFDTSTKFELFTVIQLSYNEINNSQIKAIYVLFLYLFLS